MQLIYENSRWEMICSFQEKDTVKEAGFRWDAVNKRWFTPVASIAETFKDVANETAIKALETVGEKIEMSRSASVSEMQIPVPEDKNYFPYQHAGITYACQNESTLIGDEMGLGKTIQAIGVINASKPETVLIICPATLKLNWKKELQR